MWPVTSSFGCGKAKAVQCYILLLIWLLIFSFGLYWFLTFKNSAWRGPNLPAHVGLVASDNLALLVNSESIQRSPIVNTNNNMPKFKSTTTIAPTVAITSNFEKRRKNVIPPVITRLCSPPESIKASEENHFFPSHKLQSLIIILRHGDRGPLAHIGTQNISHINCTPKSPLILNEVSEFIRFTSETLPKIPGYSTFIGPFHSFPRVATSQCSLGQLTHLGTGQLIKLGKVLRSVYKSVLTLDDPNSVRVISYSSRYRRTFQSLMAFLYGFLGTKGIVDTEPVKESQSINFCFNDCSCRGLEKLKKIATISRKKSFVDGEDLRSAEELMAHLQEVLYNGDQSSSRTSSKSTILDSLLVYPCHNAPLPCRDGSCISPEDLAALIKYIQRETKALKKLTPHRKFLALSAYGLLKEIVYVALDLMSEKQSGKKVAVFSGHDTTLQSLTGALGFFKGHPDINLPPYGSRLVFEFYKKMNLPANSPRKHFFRVLYNGIAVTSLINIGKSKSFLSTNGHALCPVENLIRFVHDQYFDVFSNATNFKDACSLKL